MFIPLGDYPKNMVAPDGSVVEALSVADEVAARSLGYTVEPVPEKHKKTAHEKPAHEKSHKGGH